MFRSGILVQKSLKNVTFHQKSGKNREILLEDLNIHIKSFAILKMHFPAKFRPYISFFIFPTFDFVGV